MPLYCLLLLFVIILGWVVKGAGISDLLVSIRSLADLGVITELGLKSISQDLGDSGQRQSRVPTSQLLQGLHRHWDIVTHACVSGEGRLQRGHEACLRWHLELVDGYHGLAVWTGTYAGVGGENGYQVQRGLQPSRRRLELLGEAALLAWGCF